MAITITPYNHTRRKFLAQDVDFGGLKVVLLNASASFTAANTQLTQVTNAGAYEVSGNGWPAGGPMLDNFAVTTVATSVAMLDADDVSEDADGGDIGPAYYAVIYDDADANDAPLWFIDFDGAKTAGAGTPFKIAFSANGIARVSAA